MQTLEYLKGIAANHRSMMLHHEERAVERRRELEKCEAMIAELESIKPLQTNKPTIIDAVATEDTPSKKRGIMRWG